MSVRATIRQEVIDALKAADGPMDRNAIFDECGTAGSAQDVSIALSQLKKTGVVERTDAGWALTAELVDQACEKLSREDTARELDAAPAAPKRNPRKEALQLLQGEPDEAGEDTDPLIERIRHMRPRTIPEARRKARVLRELADWPAMDHEIAQYLCEIAADLERLAA